MALRRWLRDCCDPYLVGLAMKCHHEMLTFLGQLGKLFWYRCQHCGIDLCSDTPHHEQEG